MHLQDYSHVVYHRNICSTHVLIHLQAVCLQVRRKRQSGDCIACDTWRTWVHPSSSRSAVLLQPCPVLIPAQRCSPWAEGSHQPSRTGQLLFSAAFRAGCVRTTLVQGRQASVLTAPGVPLHGASALWCVGIHLGIRRTRKTMAPCLPSGEDQSSAHGSWCSEICHCIYEGSHRETDRRAPLALGLVGYWALVAVCNEIVLIVLQHLKPS